MANTVCVLCCGALRTHRDVVHRAPTRWRKCSDHSCHRVPRWRTMAHTGCTLLCIHHLSCTARRTVQVSLGAQETRGRAYSLQPVDPQGGFGRIEWMVLVGEEGDGRTVAVESFTEIEPLEIAGPRTDRLRIPDDIAPGRWRLCVAFTSEPRCSEFTVDS